MSVCVRLYVCESVCVCVCVGEYCECVGGWVCVRACVCEREMEEERLESQSEISPLGIRLFSLPLSSTIFSQSQCARMSSA